MEKIVGNVQEVKKREKVVYFILDAKTDLHPVAVFANKPEAFAKALSIVEGDSVVCLGHEDKKIKGRFNAEYMLLPEAVDDDYIDPGPVPVGGWLPGAEPGPHPFHTSKREKAACLECKKTPPALTFEGLEEFINGSSS